MPEHADVIIIGAGVVGLGIAYQLSTTTGLDIAVFDKRGPGSGTSGRSAGVICRHDQGPIYQRLSLVGHTRMLEFAAAHDFGFNRWGSVSIIREPDMFPPVDEPARELADAPSGMYRTEVLGRDGLLSKFPWIAPDGVLGGIWEPNTGFINPFELIDLYRRLLGRNPRVSIDYGNGVLGLDVGDDGRIGSVVTRRGNWTADTVINASGAWAGKVAALAGASVHITPQRMNVAVAAVADEKLPPLPLHGFPEVRWDGDGLWCRGETGGTALMGQHRDRTAPERVTADPDFFDTNPDKGFTETVAPALEQYYRLPSARMIDGWTCVYDTSDDGFPIVGWDPAVPNLLHAVGMNGHGMTIHTGVARCVAALLADDSWTVDISDVMPWPERLDFSILRPSRFEEGEPLTLRGQSGGHA